MLYWLVLFGDGTWLMTLDYSDTANVGVFGPVALSPGADLTTAAYELAREQGIDLDDQDTWPEFGD